MASGKKNYFRHSFFAIDDEKIQTIISELGFEGYAYYFTLLEILSRQCEIEFKNPIRIHQQSLQNVWRKRGKSCKKVVTKLEESGLFVATFMENHIEFDIPNLSKYMGYYTIRKETNTPKESKVKERKEKKSKENIKRNKKTKNPKFDFQELGVNWFRKAAYKTGVKYLDKEIKTIDRYNSFIKASENYKASQIEADEDFKYSMGFNKFTECWEQWIDFETNAQKVLRLEAKANAILAGLDDE